MISYLGGFCRMGFSAAACIMTVVFLAATGAAGTLQEHSKELASIAEQVMPSVVSIYTKDGLSIERERRGNSEALPNIERFLGEWGKREPFDLEFYRKNLPKEMHVWRFTPPQPEPLKLYKGAGTGIIMDREGHIVTASHLVKGSREGIKVKLADEREFQAELIGADPDSGVAVIKIDAEDLTPARTGNSDDLRVAESVLAFGNIRGLGITVTTGIISALGRTDLNIVTYEDFIQTDAITGPGSGGGPLVNAWGEVIGMTIAALDDNDSSMSTGFAIPINTALTVMEDLVNKGKVSRGWLGVHIQNLSPDLAKELELEEARGALVAAAGDPAREGGIEAGDVIVEFDGKPVKDTSHLKNIVAQTKPGEEVTVVVMRKGERKELVVKLGERTEESLVSLKGEKLRPDWKDGLPPAREMEWMGITVQELNDELAGKFGYEDEEGVLIADVRKDSPADRKGLRKGDLIQEVENNPIKGIQDYKSAMKSAESENSILLRIKRGKQVWYEVIRQE